MVGQRDPLEPPGPGVDLRKLRPCDACGQPLAKRPKEPVVLNAYRIRIDSLILDMRAVNEVGGLAQYFQGHLALAEMFVPDLEIYKCFARDDELLICFDCYATQSIAVIAELARDRREVAEAEKDESSPDSQADGHRDPDDAPDRGDPGA